MSISSATRSLKSPITRVGFTRLARIHLELSPRLLRLAFLEQAGVPALAIDEPNDGVDALERRAIELKASSFTRVPEISQLTSITLGASSFSLPYMKPLIQSSFQVSREPIND